jgi:hypothetical protein
MPVDRLEISVVTDQEGFNKLREPWNRLAEANGFYTPWFCWEWFDLCLRHSEPVRLLILKVHLNNELVAIAPMEVRTKRYKGIFPARIVSFIGGSRSFLKGIVFGTTLDMLRKDATALVLDSLRTEFRSWDLLEIDPVASESEDGGFYAELLENMGLSFRSYVSCVNRYSDAISAHFDIFFENLPQSTRKDIQYCKRRLEKNGTLAFQLITGVSALDKYLDVYDEIRARSWKAPERDHIFNREIIRLAAAKGWLRLGILCYNDVPIAGQKWFVSQRRAYIYDVLYDEDYKKYSPGKLLTSSMFQYTIDNDMIVYVDYLRGDEPYKEEWAPSIRDRSGFTVFNNTMKGKLFRLLILWLLPIVRKHIKSFVF